MKQFKIQKSTPKNKITPIPHTRRQHLPTLAEVFVLHVGLCPPRHGGSAWGFATPSIQHLVHQLEAKTWDKWRMYTIQGSPSGGRRMPPGGHASRKTLRLNQKKWENRRLRDRIPKRDIVERTRVIRHHRRLEREGWGMADRDKWCKTLTRTTGSLLPTRYL